VASMSASRRTHTIYALSCLVALATPPAEQAQTGRAESLGGEPTNSQKPFWLPPWCVEGEGYTGGLPIWPPYRQQHGRGDAGPLYESRTFPGLFEGKPNGPVVAYSCNTILVCHPRERWRVAVSVFAAETVEVAKRAHHADEFATSEPVPWKHESLLGGQIGDDCFCVVFTAADGRESTARLHFRKGRVCVSVNALALTTGTVEALERQAGNHPLPPRFYKSTDQRKAEAERVARLVEAKIVYGGYAEPVATGNAEIASRKIATKTLQLNGESVTVCFLEDLCDVPDVTPVWDREWRRVTLRRDQASCELQLGRASLSASGKAVHLPMMPFLWGEERARTVIPIKHVAAALGLEIR